MVLLLCDYITSHREATVNLEIFGKKSPSKMAKLLHCLLMYVNYVLIEDF